MFEAFFCTGNMGHISPRFHPACISLSFVSTNTQPYWQHCIASFIPFKWQHLNASLATSTSLGKPTWFFISVYLAWQSAKRASFLLVGVRMLHVTRCFHCSKLVMSGQLLLWWLLENQVCCIIVVLPRWEQRLSRSKSVWWAWIWTPTISMICDDRMSWTITPCYRMPFPGKLPLAMIIMWSSHSFSLLLLNVNVNHQSFNASCCCWYHITRVFISVIWYTGTRWEIRIMYGCWYSSATTA